MDKKRFHLPTSHRPALKVPKGGSCCKNCVFYDEKGGKHGTCGSDDYRLYYGTNEIPEPPDEFCSDWWDG